MGFISKIKGKVKPVVGQVQLAPSKVNSFQEQDDYYAKGSWWIDDDDITQQDDYQFDLYSKEYHAMDNDQDRYNFYNQDRYGMIK